MQDVVSSRAPLGSASPTRISRIVSRARAECPSLPESAIALFSAVLLVLSFPNFDLWPLAWVGLVPLLLLIIRKQESLRSFFLGWLTGSVFFYGSCYWLTHSIINFGGIPTAVAFVLLVPGAVLMGLFPAVFAFLVARLSSRWGSSALLVAPVFWSALEWLRLETTGQLWNALGYSQAFHPALIQSARWGGVYLISFLLVAVNGAFAFALTRRELRRSLVALAFILGVSLLMFSANKTRTEASTTTTQAVVVAIQPNVPMDLQKSDAELIELTSRHFAMSEAALNKLPNDVRPRLLIWPESPMNFTYGTDSRLRDVLKEFAQKHHTLVLLNSQEAAPNNGVYNSAVLVNEVGSLVAQYDKIRLLPFGEYDPLPQWIPGAGLIKAIVGDFTPGTQYRLMPVGDMRVGVFICIESAYPSIARSFSNEGADVLINISNDGYLGPTAVMRQHLSNAVLRAVENGRPVLRITNSGISAFVSATGEISDATQGFQPETRVWQISRPATGLTFYAMHGDWFVITCALLSLAIVAVSFRRRAVKVK